jgi:hypothetical protein
MTIAATDECNNPEGAIDTGSPACRDVAGDLEFLLFSKLMQIRKINAQTLNPVSNVWH